MTTKRAGWAVGVGLLLTVGLVGLSFLGQPVPPIAGIRLWEWLTLGLVVSVHWGLWAGIAYIYQDQEG